MATSNRSRSSLSKTIMKNRSKKARKTMSFYQRHFGYRPPYQILVCGTFCKQALTDKINIAEQLPKYLCGEVRLQTTRCAIKECELGGSLLYGPYKVLKQYDTISCHSFFKKSDKCLFKTFSKKDTKFIIATQDDDLARKAWEENIPVLRISGRCINLDDIPRCTLQIIKSNVLKTTSLTEIQDKRIARLREEMGVKEPEPESNTESKRQRKMRMNKEGRAKARFIASKNAKSKSKSSVPKNGVNKTKRRKKTRPLADHVKQALFGNNNKKS